MEKTVQDEVGRDGIRPGYSAHRGDRVKWSAANTGDKLEVVEMRTPGDLSMIYSSNLMPAAAAAKGN